MVEQISIIRPRLLAHASLDGEIGPQPWAQRVDASLFGLSSTDRQPGHYPYSSSLNQGEIICDYLSII